jgi:hypothetical protein
MSWRDVEGSTIKVIQGKTKAELWIPLHPDLSAGAGSVATHAYGDVDDPLRRTP